MNRIRFEILGSQYRIDTAEDEAYVLTLVKEISDLAESLMRQNPKMSPNEALVLCALGSTDSYHKSEDAADNLRGQITEYLEDTARMQQELSQTRRALEDAKREIERINRHAEISAKLGGGR